MKTVSLAALFAIAASASFAGSLNQAEETAEPTGDSIEHVSGASGIGAPAVVGGLLAAAALAALISDTTTTTDATD